MTGGYASFDYDIIHREGALVKLGILVNEPVDALNDDINFYKRLEEVCEKLKDLNTVIL